MISLDIAGRIPIYEQISKQVCSLIAKGVLKEGDKLPSARMLAKDLGINPNTVAKAYSKLEDDGIIYSAAGKGCFVAKHTGEIEKKLSDEFKNKTSEALKAGISSERLIEIVRDLDSELNKGDEGKWLK